MRRFLNRKSSQKQDHYDPVSQMRNTMLRSAVSSIARPVVITVVIAVLIQIYGLPGVLIGADSVGQFHASCIYLAPHGLHYGFPPPTADQCSIFTLFPFDLFGFVKGLFA
jgi:hypothetical protein